MFVDNEKQRGCKEGFFPFIFSLLLQESQGRTRNNISIFLQDKNCDVQAAIISTWEKIPFIAWRNCLIMVKFLSCSFERAIMFSLSNFTYLELYIFKFLEDEQKLNKIVCVLGL